MTDHTTYPPQWWLFPATLAVMRDAPPVERPVLTEKERAPWLALGNACICGKPRAAIVGAPALCIDHLREYWRRRNGPEWMAADDLRREIAGRQTARTAA